MYYILFVILTPFPSIRDGSSAFKQELSMEIDFVELGYPTQPCRLAKVRDAQLPVVDLLPCTLIFEKEL